MFLQSTKKKLILPLVALFLLGIGTTATFILVKTSQDIRQQASDDLYPDEKGIITTSYTGTRGKSESDCGGVWNNNFCYMPGDELTGGLIVVESGKYDYPHLVKKEVYESEDYGKETISNKQGGDCEGKGLDVEGTCYTYGSTVNGYLIMPERTDGCDNSAGDYCYAHLKKIETEYGGWEKAVSSYENSGNVGELEKLYRETYGVEFAVGGLFDPNADNAAELKAQSLIAALTNADVIKAKATEQNKALLSKEGELTEDEQSFYDFNQQIIDDENLDTRYQTLDHLSALTAQQAIINRSLQEAENEKIAAENTEAEVVKAKVVIDGQEQREINDERAKDLENALILYSSGQLSRADLLEKVGGEDLGKYLGGVSEDQFITAIYKEFGLDQSTAEAEAKNIISVKEDNIAFQNYLNTRDIKYLQENVFGKDTPSTNLGSAYTDPEALLKSMLGKEEGGKSYQEYVLPVLLDDAIANFSQDPNGLESLCNKTLGSSCNFSSGSKLAKLNTTQTLSDFFTEVYGENSGINIDEKVVQTANALFVETRDEQTNAFQTATLFGNLADKSSEEVLLDLVLDDDQKQIKIFDDNYFSNPKIEVAYSQAQADYESALKATKVFTVQNTFEYASDEGVRGNLSNYTWGTTAGNAILYDDIFNRNYDLENDLGLTGRDARSLGWNQIGTQLFGVQNNVENVATNYAVGREQNYDGPANTNVADLVLQATQNLGGDYQTALGYDYQAANDGFYGDLNADNRKAAFQGAVTATFKWSIAEGEQAQAAALQENIQKRAAEAVQEYGLNASDYVAFQTEDEIVRSRTELDWERAEKIIAPAVAVVALPIAAVSGAGIAVGSGVASGAFSFYQGAGQRAQAFELERTIISQDEKDGQNIAAKAIIAAADSAGEEVSYEEALAEVESQAAGLKYQSNMMLASSAVATFTTGSGIITGLSGGAASLTGVTNVLSGVGRVGGIGLSGLTAVTATKQSVSSFQQIAAIDQQLAAGNLTAAQQQKLLDDRKNEVGSAWTSGASAVVSVGGAAGNFFSFAKNPTGVTTGTDLWVDRLSLPIGSGVDMYNVSQSCFGAVTDEKSCNNAWVGLALGLTQDITQIRNSGRAAANFKNNVEYQRLADQGRVDDLSQRLGLVNAEIVKTRAAKGNLVSLETIRSDLTTELAKLDPSFDASKPTRKIIVDASTLKLIEAAQENLEKSLIEAQGSTALEQKANDVFDHQADILKTSADILDIDRQLGEGLGGMSALEIEAFKTKRTSLVDDLNTKVNDPVLKVANLDEDNQRLLANAQANKVLKNYDADQAAKKQVTEAAEKENLPPPDDVVEEKKTNIFTNFIENRKTNQQVADLKDLSQKLGTKNLEIAEQVIGKQAELNKLEEAGTAADNNDLQKIKEEIIDLQEAAQSSLKGENALVEVDQSGDYTVYKVTEAGEKAKLENSQLDLLNSTLKSFEEFQRQATGIEKFKIYSKTGSFKDQDVFLLAELEAIGAGRRGTVFGALPGMGKTDVVMPFGVMLKQRLTNDSQFVVFPESKLMKPWVSDANYTPNKKFIDYVESEFGEGSVLIVKPNDQNIDPAAIAKAKFIITTKDAAFDLQSTALRNKWKESHSHADEVDWTFNPNESYKLSGKQVALQDKPEYSLYLTAQRKILGIDGNGRVVGDGLSSLRTMLGELEQSKSIPTEITRTSDGKAGKFADQITEKRVLNEWLSTWGGQSKIADLDLDDVEVAREKINSYLTHSDDDGVHQLRAELAMINDAVNFMSRVPGEDYGLTSNTRLVDGVEETVNSIAPREKGKESGRSYSAVAEQLLYNSIGARVLGDSGKINLAKLSVGEGGSDINYAQLMLESKGFSLYTGTPETVAKLYKMAYGIDLQTFTDSAVDDSIIRFKNPPANRKSGVFTNLKDQVAARLNNNENQVFINMAEGLRDNKAMLADLVKTVSGVAVDDEGNNISPYKKLFLIGANGELVEHRVTDEGGLEKIAEFIDTDALNKRTAALDINGERYIKFYEFGAHVGVDTKTNVEISRAVGICHGCDETTFGQGINRLRVDVSVGNDGKAVVKHASIDVVWLDAPSRNPNIDDFAVNINQRQVINEALAEVAFKEVLLRNSVDKTFVELIELARDGGGGILGIGAYKANPELVEQLELARQQWKETSEMNYLLGNDDMTAQVKLQKTAEQVAAAYKSLERMLDGSGAPAKLLAGRADGALGEGQNLVKLAFVGDEDYKILSETPSYKEIVELINNSSKHLEEVDIAFLDRRSPAEVVERQLDSVVRDAEAEVAQTRVADVEDVVEDLQDLSLAAANPVRLASTFNRYVGGINSLVRLPRLLSTFVADARLNQQNQTRIYRVIRGDIAALDEKIKNLDTNKDAREIVKILAEISALEDYIAENVSQTTKVSSAVGGFVEAARDQITSLFGEDLDRGGGFEVEIRRQEEVLEEDVVSETEGSQGQITELDVDPEEFFLEFGGEEYFIPKLFTTSDEIKIKLEESKVLSYEGGQGVVIEGVGIADGKKYLVKLFNNNKSTRDMNEAQISFYEKWGKSNIVDEKNINVTKYRGKADYKGHTIIATDFVEGTSLFNLYHFEDSKISKKQAQQIIKDLLHLYKETGVVHGDARIINVLVTPEGLLKLIDHIGDPQARFPEEKAITFEEEILAFLKEVNFATDGEIELNTDQLEVIKELDQKTNLDEVSESEKLAADQLAAENTQRQQLSRWQAIGGFVGGLSDLVPQNMTLSTLQKNLQHINRIIERNLDFTALESAREGKLEESLASLQSLARDFASFINETQEAENEAVEKELAPVVQRLDTGEVFEYQPIDTSEDEVPNKQVGDVRGEGSKQATSYRKPGLDLDMVDIEHYAWARKQLKSEALGSRLFQVARLFDIETESKNEDEIYQEINQKFTDQEFLHAKQLSLAIVVDAINGDTYKYNNDNRYDNLVEGQNSAPRQQSIFEAVANSIDAILSDEENSQGTIGQFGKGIKQALTWLSSGSEDKIEVWSRETGGQAYKTTIIKDSQGQYYIQTAEVELSQYLEHSKNNQHGTIIKIFIADGIPPTKQEVSSNQYVSQEEIVTGLHKRYPFVTDIRINTKRSDESDSKYINGYETKQQLIPQAEIVAATSNPDGTQRIIDVEFTKNTVAIMDNGRGMNAQVIADMFVPQSGTKHPAPLSGEATQQELEKVKAVYDSAADSPKRLSFARNGEVIMALDIPQNIIAAATVDHNFMIDGSRLFDVSDARDAIKPDIPSSGQVSNFQAAISRMVAQIATNQTLDIKQKLQFINTMTVGLDKISTDANAKLLIDIKKQIRQIIKPLISKLEQDDYVVLPHFEQFEKINIPEDKKDIVYLDPDIFNWLGVASMKKSGAKQIPGIYFGDDQDIPLLVMDFTSDHVGVLKEPNRDLVEQNAKDWLQVVDTESYIVIPTQFGKRLAELADKFSKDVLTEAETLELKALVQAVNIHTATKVVTDYEVAKNLKKNANLVRFEVEEGQVDSLALGNFLQPKDHLLIADKKIVSPEKEYDLEAKPKQLMLKQINDAPINDLTPVSSRAFGNWVSDNYLGKDVGDSVVITYELERRIEFTPFEYQVRFIRLDDGSFSIEFGKSGIDLNTALSLGAKIKPMFEEFDVFFAGGIESDRKDLVMVEFNGVKTPMLLYDDHLVHPGLFGNYEYGALFKNGETIVIKDEVQKKLNRILFPTDQVEPELLNEIAESIVSNRTTPPSVETPPTTTSISPQSAPKLGLDSDGFVIDLVSGEKGDGNIKSLVYLGNDYYLVYKKYPGGVSSFIIQANDIGSFLETADSYLFVEKEVGGKYVGRGADGSPGFFDASTGEHLKFEGFISTTLSSDGKYLAIVDERAAGNYNLLVRELNTDEPQTVFRIPDANVQAIKGTSIFVFGNDQSGYGFFDASFEPTSKLGQEKLDRYKEIIPGPNYLILKDFEGKITLYLHDEGGHRRILAPGGDLPEGEITKVSSYVGRSISTEISIRKKGIGLNRNVVEFIDEEGIFRSNPIDVNAGFKFEFLKEDDYGTYRSLGSGKNNINVTTSSSNSKNSYIDNDHTRVFVEPTESEWQDLIISDTQGEVDLFAIGSIVAIKKGDVYGGEGEVFGPISTAYSYKHGEAYFHSRGDISPKLLGKAIVNPQTGAMVYKGQNSWMLVNPKDAVNIIASESINISPNVYDQVWNDGEKFIFYSSEHKDITEYDISSTGGVKSYNTIASDYAAANTVEELIVAVRIREQIKHEDTDEKTPAEEVIKRIGYARGYNVKIGLDSPSEIPLVWKVTRNEGLATRLAMLLEIDGAEGYSDYIMPSPTADLSGESDYIDNWNKNVIGENGEYREEIISNAKTTYEAVINSLPEDIQSDREINTKLSQDLQTEYRLAENDLLSQFSKNPEEFKFSDEIDHSLISYSQRLAHLTEDLPSFIEELEQQLIGQPPRMRRVIYRNLIKNIFDLAASDKSKLDVLRPINHNFYYGLAYGWEVGNSQEVFDATFEIGGFIQKLNQLGNYQAEVQKLIISLRRSFGHSNQDKVTIIRNQIQRLLEFENDELFVDMLSKLKKVELGDIETSISPDGIKPIRNGGDVMPFIQFLTNDAALVREELNPKSEQLQGEGVSLEGSISIPTIQKLERLRSGSGVMSVEELIAAIDSNSIYELDLSDDQSQADLAELLKNISVQRESGAYAGEVAQNSYDATGKNIEQDNVEKGQLFVDFYTSGDEYVEEMTDNGTGAINPISLLIPKSDKQAGSQTESVGFFGTGKFTIYEGVDRVEMITNNNETAVKFSLRVVRDEYGKPQNVVLESITKLDKNSTPIGVTVRRIKSKSNSLPELESMIAQRSWKVFAGLTQNENFEIKVTNGYKIQDGESIPEINAIQIDGLETLAETKMKVKKRDPKPEEAEFIEGVVRTYAADDMPLQIVDRIGLRVAEYKDPSTMSDDELEKSYFALIPREYLSHFEELGLIIQIPLPLNRDRKSFASEDFYLKEIQKYVAISFTKALAFKRLNDSNKFTFYGFAEDSLENVGNYKNQFDPKSHPDIQQIKKIAELVNAGQLDQVDANELAQIMTLEDENMVKLVKLLMVEDRKSGEKISLFIRRLNYLMEIDKEQAEKELGQIFDSSANSSSGGIREIISRAGGDDDIRRTRVATGKNIAEGHKQISNPERYVVTPSNTQEKKMLDVATLVTKLLYKDFGIDEVRLVEGTSFAGAFNFSGLDKGILPKKKIFYLSSDLSDQMGIEGYGGAIVERNMDLIIHELAHALESQIKETDYLSDTSTHQAIGRFADAMKYLSGRLLTEYDLWLENGGESFEQVYESADQRGVFVDALVKLIKDVANQKIGRFPKDLAMVLEEGVDFSREGLEPILKSLQIYVEKNSGKLDEEFRQRFNEISESENSFNDLCSDCAEVRAKTKTGMQASDELMIKSVAALNQARANRELAHNPGLEGGENRAAELEAEAKKLEQDAEQLRQQALDRIDETREKVIDEHGMQNQCVQLYLRAWTNTREAEIRENRADTNKAIASVYQATVIAEELLATNEMEIVNKKGFLGIGKKTEVIALNEADLEDIGGILDNTDPSEMGLRQMAEFEIKNGQLNKKKVIGGVLGELRDSEEGGVFSGVGDQLRIWGRGLSTFWRQRNVGTVSQTTTLDLLNSENESIEEYVGRVFTKDRRENMIEESPEDLVKADGGTALLYRYLSQEELLELLQTGVVDGETGGKTRVVTISDFLNQFALHSALEDLEELERRLSNWGFTDIQAVIRNIEEENISALKIATNELPLESRKELTVKGLMPASFFGLIPTSLVPMDSVKEFYIEMMVPSKEWVLHDEKKIATQEFVRDVEAHVLLPEIKLEDVSMVYLKGEMGFTSSQMENGKKEYLVKQFPSTENLGGIRLDELLFELRAGNKKDLLPLSKLGLTTESMQEITTLVDKNKKISRDETDRFTAELKSKRKLGYISTPSQEEVGNLISDLTRELETEIDFADDSTLQEVMSLYYELDSLVATQVAAQLDKQTKLARVVKLLPATLQRLFGYKLDEKVSVSKNAINNQLEQEIEIVVDQFGQPINSPAQLNLLKDKISHLINRAIELIGENGLNGDEFIKSTIMGYLVSSTDVDVSIEEIRRNALREISVLVEAYVRLTTLYGEYSLERVTIKQEAIAGLAMSNLIIPKEANISGFYYDPALPYIEKRPGLEALKAELAAKYDLSIDGTSRLDINLKRSAGLSQPVVNTSYQPLKSSELLYLFSSYYDPVEAKREVRNYINALSNGSDTTDWEHRILEASRMHRDQYYDYRSSFYKESYDYGIENLALVHLTDFSPSIEENIAKISHSLESTGFPRTTIHFTVQSPVHDVNAMSKLTSWKDNEIAFIMPMQEAVEVNGLPINVKWTDTFWGFAKDEKFIIPSGSVLLIKAGNPLEEAMRQVEGVEVVIVDEAKTVWEQVYFVMQDMGLQPDIEQGLIIGDEKDLASELMSTSQLHMALEGGLYAGAEVVIDSRLKDITTDEQDYLEMIQIVNGEKEGDASWALSRLLEMGHFSYGGDGGLEIYPDIKGFSIFDPDYGKFPLPDSEVSIFKEPSWGRSVEETLLKISRQEELHLTPRYEAVVKFHLMKSELWRYPWLLDRVLSEFSLNGENHKNIKDFLGLSDEEMDFVSSSESDILSPIEKLFEHH